MPVWAPSRCGSIRMVATTRVAPPGAGYTLTSPKGSTVLLSWVMEILQVPCLRQVLPNTLPFNLQHEIRRAGRQFEFQSGRHAGIRIILDHPVVRIEDFPGF